MSTFTKITKLKYLRIKEGYYYLKLYGRTEAEPLRKAKWSAKARPVQFGGTQIPG